jgi:hypothetical protein
MTTQVIVSSPAIDTGILAIARNALVEEAVKTGGVIQAYANALCDVFDRKDANGKVIAKWFDLVGKEKKGVKAERALFCNAMMDRDPRFIKSTNADGTRKHTASVDTYWMRVKEASGYVPNGRVSGSSDIDSKTLAELKTMINRIYKADEDGIECNALDFLVNLKDVFEGMGGDVMDLGKNLK